MKVFPIILLLLLVVACMPRTMETDYHSGSDGIIATFTPKYPPPEIYEGTTVPVILSVVNRGSASVDYADIYLTVKTDPFYASVLPGKWADEGPAGKVLVGRGPGFPRGDYQAYQTYVDFHRVKGLRESPSTQVFASYCYPYATSLGTSVCVDTNAFNQNEQRQVCAAQTMTFRDQGAPVAVTSIENRPTPIQVVSPGGRAFMDLSQPVFIIHVANVGTGRVVMPVPLQQENQVMNETAMLARIAAGLFDFEPLLKLPGQEDRESACAGDFDKETLNQVTISATLSGINLTCDPKVITLHDDKGFTACALPEEELEGLSYANYLGVFRVDLGYLYRDSTSADVEILRREPSIAWQNYTVSERDANPGFVEGEPRCNYCDRSPGSSECDGWPVKDKQMAKINEPFSCSCSKTECLTLYNTSRCVFGAYWCPGTSYCCAREP
ncbi:hypothetical protein GOV07_04480 [Candidatus Woesearchaeota archaeon]|nr:hypothetical protein [Candidatus Woesearchaeota archaeon]